MKRVQPRVQPQVNVETDASSCLSQPSSLAYQLPLAVRWGKLASLTQANIPKVHRMWSIDTLPSTRISLVNHLKQNQVKIAPSMTTFKLLRSPWITFSVGATVTRASFGVSPSNFCRMTAMQISPLNLSPNFSAPLLVR
jgi:hypothetical protein